MSRKFQHSRDSESTSYRKARLGDSDSSSDSDSDDEEVDRSMPFKHGKGKKKIKGRFKKKKTIIGKFSKKSVKANESCEIVDDQLDDGGSGTGDGDQVPFSFTISSVTWNDREAGEKDCVELCGRDDQGLSIKVDMPWKQFMRMELPADVEMTPEVLERMALEIKKQLGWKGNKIANVDYEELVPARPFRFGRKKKILKLSFDKFMDKNNVLGGLRNINSVTGSDSKFSNNRFSSNTSTTDPDVKLEPGTILLEGKPQQVIIYESDIKPVTRFCQTTELNAAGWVTCKKWKDVASTTACERSDFIPGGPQPALTDRHIKVEAKDLVLDLVKNNTTAVHSTAIIFDIETSFCLDPNDEIAEVYQISCIHYNSSTNEIRPILFTYNPHLVELEKMDLAERIVASQHEKYKDVEIEGVEVRNLTSEKEVLEEFARFLREEDPDDIVGHNIYGFDMNYLITRAGVLDIPEYEFLGRTGAPNDQLKTTINRRDVAYQGIPGRLVLDTMFYLMSYDKAQTSYSLESCSEMHLENLTPLCVPTDNKGEQKSEEKPPSSLSSSMDPDVKDVKIVDASTKPSAPKKFSTIQETLSHHFKDLPTMLTNKKGEVAGETITNHFASENYEKRKELAVYCVKDSVLALRLYVERTMRTKVYKMAEAFRAPMQVIMVSGKGEQVIPNILREIHKKNILYNKYHDESLDPYADLWAWQPYPGGLVRPPVAGKYLDPVAVLDFSGMYPSIMMEEKICMQTMLPTSYFTKDDWIDLERYEYTKTTVREVEVVIIRGIRKPPDKSIAPDNNNTATSEAKAPSDTITNSTGGFVFASSTSPISGATDNGENTNTSGDSSTSSAVDEFDDDELTPGFSFVIQENMKTWRDVAKGKMKQATNIGDEVAKVIFDCEQLAYKIYMNGMYGLFAPVTGGQFTYLLVAAAITQYGREKSDLAKKFLENYPPLKARGIKIVYGDTDSLFIVFTYPKFDDDPNHTKLMQWAFEFNKMVAEAVTASFKSKYILIELEKHYFPMILFDKKKYYCGIKWLGWGKDKDGKKIWLPPNKKPDIVGIEGKKRDRCEHLRELQFRIIGFLLQTRSTEEEMIFEIKKALMALANNEVPLEKLIIVKGLSKTIEEYGGAKLPHVSVARRLHARGQDGCGKGARVSYIVYTDKNKYRGVNGKAIKGKKWGISDYCEDAKFAISNKMRPDPYYYILYHYKKALAKLLAPINIDIDKLYEEPAAIAIRTANVGQTSLRDSLPQHISRKAKTATSSVAAKTMDESKEEKPAMQSSLSSSSLSSASSAAAAGSLLKLYAAKPQVAQPKQIRSNFIQKRGDSVQSPNAIVYVPDNGKVKKVVKRKAPLPKVKY